MKRTLLYIFLLWTSFIYGQGLFDSTAVGLVEGGLNTYYDTILNIQTFHGFNDYGREEFGIVSMGNQGDVRRRLTFHSLTEPMPYLGIDGYFKNYLTSDKLPYYNVKAPSGGIRLLTGYSKGQMFGLNFTINPITRLNVFVDFQRINSQGNYLNQENKSDQLKITSSYYTKKEGYKLNWGLAFNKATSGEFGGIADTVAFTQNTLTNRELIDIRLSSSASAARQINVVVDQQLRLLHLKKSELSTFFSFNAITQSHSFASSDSIFVLNAAFQEAPIRDSIRFSKIENFAGLKWSFKSDSSSLANKQEVIFGAKYISSVYGNTYFRQAENNLGLNASFSGIQQRFFWSANGTLMLTNEYAGANELTALAGFSLVGPSYIMISASTQTTVPSLFAQRFISNNFIWNSDFSNLTKNSVLAKIKIKNISFVGGADFLTNYIYYNQEAVPEQLDATMGIYYAEGQGTLPLGANFYLDSRIRYQYTSNEYVVRIPNWVIREVLYLERNVFAKAARIQTGVEFNYFSRFVSEAYMPATSVMYLQDNISIGNFPYFNFLFNFKIKDFTFFLRLENITQGLFKYNYYAAPYYPLPDFALRVGATWRFFN
jgi:hypothetical protein